MTTSDSTRFHDTLARQLAALDAASMRRHLRGLDTLGKHVTHLGKPLLNLAGNDYLALAQHPRLKRAAIRAIEAHGTGSGSSRLVAGTLTLHEQVEAKLAAWKHTEAALVMSSGYVANLAALTALTRPGDLLCQDKLNHASLLDAARLAGAMHQHLEVRTYPHRDLDRLEALLSRHAEKRAASRDKNTSGGRFIVTDSVFSMDGDVADLPALCDLAERYDAVLVVDEAHATGVLGTTGSGLVEAQGVVGRVDVVVSTASKALGGLGGIVTGRRGVIDTLISKARPFIYSTAAPPSQVAAIGEAVDVVRDEPWRREHLAALGTALRAKLAAQGWLGLEQQVATPIIPLIVGSVESALRLAERLEQRGIFAVAIRPPTVAPGSSRVRLSLRADLSLVDVERVAEAVGRRE